VRKCFGDGLALVLALILEPLGGARRRLTSHCTADKVD
jgi:hypothetical protein